MSRLPRCISLKRILASASFIGCADIVVDSITDHSSRVQEGDLFVAKVGAVADGHDFAQQAADRGADAILCQKPLAEIGLPQCVVPCVAEAYARLCQALHGFPSTRLPLVGVTGTDGKTTTCWLLRSILSQPHGGRPPRPVALSGTIDIDDGLTLQPASMTTPGPMELAEWLGRAKSHGVTAGIIELSSHALDQKRAAGVSLDAAIVTSLARDHLDYHANEHAYMQSKAAIVDLVKRGGRIVLAASAADAIFQLASPAERQVVVFGEHEAATASVSVQNETRNGLELTLHLENQSVDVTTSLIGRHNADNILAAALAALHLGATPEMIQNGVAAVDVVPGRLEAIETDGSFDLFVDYAHTPKAIETVVAVAKRIARGRVIVVCGAGGERDVGKRPLMGQALREADHVILTSDNPRSEDPVQICREIIAGLPTNCSHQTEIDRRSAIERAVRRAKIGDLVLVLGKGHEVTQRVNDDIIDFDDRVASADAVAKWKTENTFA